MNTTNNTAPFRISLKAARVNANMSQQVASKAMGVDVSTLRNWENGITIPDWDKVGEIEKLYGMSAEYIFLQRKSALSNEDGKTA